ncbi:MAG TPA: hypothetical protein PK299_10185 [Anaerolineales bacterium]|nr:hypothetical protein [Anaerolineales bacterium]
MANPTRKSSPATPFTYGLLSVSVAGTVAGYLLIANTTYYPPVGEAVGETPVAESTAQPDYQATIAALSAKLTALPTQQLISASANATMIAPQQLVVPAQIVGGAPTATPEVLVVQETAIPQEALLLPTETAVPTAEPTLVVEATAVDINSLPSVVLPTQVPPQTNFSFPPARSGSSN